MIFPNDTISIISIVIAVSALFLAFKHRNHRLVLSICSLLCFSVAAIFFALSTITTSGDHQRGQDLAQDIKANYDFGSSELYFTGLSRSDHVDIHNDYTDQEVEQILEVITNAQSRRSDKKTIVVRFHDSHHDSSTQYKEFKVKK